MNGAGTDRIPPNSCTLAITFKTNIELSNNMIPERNIKQTNVGLI